MPQIFVFAIGKRDKQAQRNLASFWCEIGGEGLGMASFVLGVGRSPVLPLSG